MKFNYALVMVLAGSSLAADAQVMNYSAESIKDELKGKASVVKRYEKIVYEASSVDRSTVTYHQIFTVLNESGKDALTKVIHSSAFISLTDFEANALDQSGKVARRFKKKDLTATVSGEGLIDDGHIYYLAASPGSYPATIEFKYQQKIKGTFFVPSYFIQSADESVELSSFTVKAPKELLFRFRPENIELQPEKSEDEKTVSYTWTVRDRPAKAREPQSPNTFPYVQLAPGKFKMAEFSGDLSTWKSFGEAYSRLAGGLDELPADRQQFFKGLVKNATTPHEKTKILYNYLQQNFRYVSIQLGIGGWRPLSAAFTDQKKYGDCKGLSNYLMAALKAVDVTSHVALINAGTNKGSVSHNFPVNSFNHMILCVIPQPKDTIWLECTSNTTDFGVLGDFTENRNALLITENGGVLVATPRSRSTENRFSAHTVVRLEHNGSAIVKTALSATGEFKDPIRQTLLEGKLDQQKRYLVNYFGFRQPDDFLIKKRDGAHPLVTDIEMAFAKVPEFTAGNKMFLASRIYRLWDRKLPKAEGRTQDFYFKCPEEYSDTTVFMLPEGFSAEALPKSKNLDCEYASFETHYRFDEKERAIYSITELRLKNHLVAAAAYPSVKKFFDEVLAYESQRIVIRKDAM